MIKNNTLSEKKIIAIQSLMRSRTCTEAAKAAGVSRVTIYKWLKKDDLFNAELDKQKNELIKRSSRKLAGALDQAVDVLIDLLEAKDQTVRRLSAGNLIDFCLKFSDITDIEKRIKALEETIK